MTTTVVGAKFRPEIDPIVVERLIAGRPPAHSISALELHAAIDYLDEVRGLSLAEIAEHCGVSPRSVLRRRSARKADEARRLAKLEAVPA